MTKLEALKALDEKVKAGDLDWPYCAAQHVHGIGMNESVWNSYSGSLDAAKALHEAVLPGWEWFRCGDTSDFFVGDGTHLDDYWAEDEDPARAWLLAIIKALIAQEAETDV